MRRGKVGAAGRQQPAPTAEDKQRTGKCTSKRAQSVSPEKVRATIAFYAPPPPPRRRVE